MNFSFAGCGFLGIYHVGVASCLRQHAPHLIETCQFAGASAGAIVSCCLICNCCLGDCTTFTLRLATKARSSSLGPFHPRFKIVKILRDALQEVLPDNAHEIASGKLHISLTRVSDWSNVVVSDYSSKEELIQRYVDGGLSDNIPAINEHTVSISPFSGESDICPKDLSANPNHIYLANTSMQMTMENVYRLSRTLFPPHPAILSDMCQQGFDDTLKYLQNNNLLSCVRHLSVRSVIRQVKVPVMEVEPTSVTSDPDLDMPSTSGVPIPSGMPSASGSPDTSSMPSTSSVPRTSDMPRRTSISCVDQSVDCDQDHCHDCKQRRHLALVDKLPHKVGSALQEAIDDMNRGLKGYVNRHRSLKILSLLATPWFLPVDMSLTFAVRFLEYLPHFPHDVQAIYKETADLLRYLVTNIRHHRRRYTARFTCQLAITEVDYKLENDIFPTPSPQHRSQSPANHPNIRNLNFEFAVDLDTKKNQTQSNNASGSLDPLPLHGDDMRGLRLGARPRSDSSCARLNSPLLLKKHLQSSGVNAEWFDTFEQCLHVTNQMESVMAYHYRDEGNTGCYMFEELYTFAEGDIETGFENNQPETVDFGERPKSQSEGHFDKKVKLTHLEKDLEEFLGQRSIIVLKEDGVIKTDS